MIIISQDKSEIINFDNTLNICIYPKYDDLDNEIEYEIFAGMKAPDDNYRILGYYKTQKRAQAVLEEIAERYSEYRVSANGYFSIVPKIYEMPKD